MDELISKRAVIEAIEKARANVGHNLEHAIGKSIIEILDDVGRDINRLQPAQPKRGKWIYGEDSMADCVDGYRCDQCGFFVPWDYQHKSIDYIKDYNFCPNCGADMRGEICE